MSTRAQRVAPLACALAAFLGGAWMLGLPFQLDDYVLLDDPLAIFGEVRGLEQRTSGAVTGFMLRFPLWLYWELLALLGGELRCPLLYHLANLCVHAGVTALLCKLVLRHYAGPGALLAGVLAGLGFGLSGGHLQAVSWTAAGSDLLFPCFALLGCTALLGARARTGVAARAWVALAGAWILLALLSKTPALVVLPAIALVCLATAPAERRARLCSRELGLLLVCALALLLTRQLYLGSTTLRYGTIESPGIAGLPGALRGVCALLAQALYPWNRDAAFADLSPLFAGLPGMQSAWGPSSWSAAFTLLVLGMGVAASPVARRAIALLLLIAVGVALPGGLLAHAPELTNVHGRLAYAPFVPLWGALGIALAASWTRWRGPALGVGCWFAFVLADGRAHVIITEGQQADYQRRALALFQELSHEQEEDTASEAELVVLQIARDFGYGGIPSLGIFAMHAMRPPFTASPGLEVRPLNHTQALRQTLSWSELARTDLAVVGPAPIGLEHDQLVGAHLRQAMELRLLEPRRRGVAAGSGPIAAVFQWTRESIDGGERWSPSPALPAHALGALRIELADGPVLSGQLVLERDSAEPIVQAVELAASDAPRVLVLDALHASADARPGPDIVALRWLAALPLALAPEPRARLPRVQVQSLLEGPLVLRPEAAPPRIRIEPPLEGPPPRYARARFEIAMPLDSANFYADVPLEGPGPWEIALDHLHLGVENVPAQTTWPWAEFFEIARSMGLLELDPLSAEVALWVELTSASGLPLAQCASLRLPWSRGPD